VTRHTKNGKRKISQGVAAARLGVTREHLNRVLRGHRQSRRLMSAWNEIQREQ
jgi:hypothetical protein